jgi:hypothetical protein
MMNKLVRNKIENYSHRDNVMGMGVEVVKARDCQWIQEYTLTGDAPKGFVRIYDYETNSNVRRRSPKTWTQYIAKTGHKWYPIESVTEYLLNRLGIVFGLEMADSRLCIINGQLRFLSRYFLERNEELVHGAEIFAGYIEDLAFVESVEQADLSRVFFTLQFVETAIEKAFPSEKQHIMHELVRLLLYDAMVGNNDRHFYNWAVIRSLDSNRPARFSPVYDTARGLFWNISDDRLEMRIQNKDVPRFVKKYCDASRPKLGWEGEKELNHFRLVEKIFENEFYITHDELSQLFSKNMLLDMEKTINKKFTRLLSPIRKSMISECLQYRFNKIQEIIQ